MENVEKVKQKRHLSLIIFLVVLIGLLVVLGMNVKQFSQKQLNPVVETSKKAAQQSSATRSDVEAIVGAYRDDEDGAAIVLNEDGTGRYVYADKHNPDTDDQLTWKKDGDQYQIDLRDKDVVNPLTAKLTGKQLVISGNGGWNTESFQQVAGQLDLTTFLRQQHGEK